MDIVIRNAFFITFPRPPSGFFLPVADNSFTHDWSSLSFRSLLYWTSLLCNSYRPMHWWICHTLSKWISHHRERGNIWSVYRPTHCPEKMTSWNKENFFGWNLVWFEEVIFKIGLLFTPFSHRLSRNFPTNGILKESLINFLGKDWGFRFHCF